MKRFLGVVFASALLFLGLVPAHVLAIDPVALATPITTDEDAAMEIELSATDPDGGTITSFDIVDGPAKGSLGSVSAIDCVSTAPACTATVTFTPAANLNGADEFDFTATDSDDETSSVATASISITAVNDEPTFTKGGNQTDNEDAGPQTINGWATAVSEGAANESGQVVTFDVSADDTSLFAVQPAVSANGNLTYTPADEANGSATVSVTPTDDGGTSSGGDDTGATQTFTITINPVNDAPSFTAGADESLLEDAGPQSTSSWATGISTGPANESGQDVTFQMVTNSNPGLFAVLPSVSAGGTLDYTPADDAHGVANLSVRITDDGGTTAGGDNTSDPQSFSITIGSVNDAPSFTGGGDVGASEDAGPQTVMGWASAISAGAADESGQALTFVVTNNDNPTLFQALGQPAVDASGDLTFRPGSNKNGIANVTVHLEDDGGTANGGADTSSDVTFAIDVSGVDDAPVAANDLFTVRLPSATAIDVRANDLGGPNEQGDPTHITSVSGAARGFVTITGGGTGITYDPFGCGSGTDTLTYTLADAGGQTDTATVLITVSGPSTFPAADGARPSFVTGSTIGSTTPVRLSWCGSASGTSVKAYRLYESKNGGSFKTLTKSTTATATTRNLPLSPTTEQFRIRVTDKKGHTGTGTGPRFRVVRTQDSSSAIVYSAGWSKTTAGSPSGGSAKAASGTGRTATFTFTGRSFAIVGTEAKKHGSFNVFVDGVKVTSSAISTKSKKTHYRQVLYSRSTTAGSHTIQVVTASGRRVDLDAILTIAIP